MQQRTLAENADLRECLKMLQRELLEIASLKSDAFKRRYEAEFKQAVDDSLVAHDIQPVREELFDAHFENSGREIIPKFQENIRRLRDFMGRIDRETKQLSVFADEEDDVEGKEFSNLKSVAQLRNLVRNYKAVTECQEKLLEAQLVKSANIPPPDEIGGQSRFKVVSEREIQEMQERLAEQRLVLDKDQKDLENKRQYAAQTAKWLDEEKIKISKKREEFDEIQRQLNANEKIAFIRDIQ